jgi:HEPN domain-containing protein/predicted nucleotidyltransferase
VKTSLDHLPPRKQRQIAAVVADLRRAAEVEMVILFGSHARGDWVEDPKGGYFSDYDLLVIVKSSKLVDQHDLWSTIEQNAQHHTAPAEVSLIVHDIDDMNWQLERGYYFFSDIRKEGIVLYDAQRFTLAGAKEQDPEARRSFAKENFERWFESAGQFYETHEFHLAKGWLKLAAFDLHQAAEHYYTAALLTLTAYKPKTHNLETMGKRAADLHPAFRDVFPRADPEDARLFKLLKNAYVDARYNSKFTITEAELAVLAARVRELRARVERVCRERIEGTAPRAEGA